ncbi:multidrug effflux MFS transporter [Nakamurella sp. DB0629]|uniref:Multidrug effflux MFS transporter n=1 Tax=Nakamurella aerolata TaxID=1656892 RepID=A0A849A5S9_9ACTN|nr:multidrug effflux MFS transporter [Nakamurella aerolata]NNG35919.1 multidrug effflux MFS transporter [Nakamurella aerolata]
MVITLGALSAFGPLCLDMYLPALPQLPAALRSTEAMAQLSLTACIVGLGVGQLVVGPLSDRLGRRWPLLVGVAVFTATSIGCAVATSMPVLIGLRLLQGVAGASGIVVGRAVVADLFAGRRAAGFFSTMTVINGLAPILAPLIGGQILRWGDWRLVFWVLAGIGVALLVATALVIDETLPPRRRATGGFGALARAVGTVLGDRVTMGYVLAGTAVAAAMFGYISASPFLLQDGFSLTPQQFSLCFAANAVGIVVAGQTSAVALRRGARPLVLLTFGVVQAAAGALLLMLAVWLRWPLGPVLIGLWVLVSAVGLTLPNASALAMDRHRPVAGAASAVIGLLQFGTAGLTSQLVGFGDRGRGLALGVVAVGCVAVAGVALAMARRSAPPNDVSREPTPQT